MRSCSQAHDTTARRFARDLLAVRPGLVVPGLEWHRRWEQPCVHHDCVASVQHTHNRSVRRIPGTSRPTESRSFSLAKSYSPCRLMSCRARRQNQ